MGEGPSRGSTRNSPAAGISPPGASRRTPAAPGRAALSQGRGERPGSGARLRLCPLPLPLPLPKPSVVSEEMIHYLFLDFYKANCGPRCCHGIFFVRTL